MAAEEKELAEKDFIHEEYGRNPFPFWGWLLAVIAFTALFSWGLSTYTDTLSHQYADSPFLRVTNRQISLFLWQNPSHMRAHAKNKNGYLPAFQYAEKIGLNPDYADDYAIAPPELLFLYHTWHRLVSNEFPLRSISTEEFQVFLVDVEEWQPRYWKEAPQGYVELVNSLAEYGDRDLNSLSESVLPLPVRQAFIGWKNYFYEGDRINAFKPTLSEVVAFLKKYPHYARPYWKNIVGQGYLQSLYDNQGHLKSIDNLLDVDLKSSISEQELAPFLRVALYNANISEPVNGVP